MIPTIGINELLIIFAILALLFGASKVPELARAAGKSIGEFRKARAEAEAEAKKLEEELKLGEEEEKVFVENLRERR